MNINSKNDLKIFEKLGDVTAGFTRKPDAADARRNDMICSGKEVHGCVVKPILVHGIKVACVTKELIGSESYIEIPDTDGVVTDLANVVLTTTHADCIPLYAYDAKKKVIALAHAGWKGTAGGIARELITVMIKNYGCKPDDIEAYIGPGICKSHFEFGKDYAAECFTANFDWMKDYIVESEMDKVKIDLKGINQNFFNLAGVNKVEIYSECTYCDERYYSFRRAKDEERMLAYITMDAR